MWIDRWSGLASAMAIQVLLLANSSRASNCYRNTEIVYEVGIPKRIRLGFPHGSTHFFQFGKDRAAEVSPTPLRCTASI